MHNGCRYTRATCFHMTLMSLPRFLLLGFSVLAVAATSAPAQAQAKAGVRRCTLMSGETVYTDKQCEDIGGMDRLPEIRMPSAAPAATDPYLRTGCSRTLSDLVYQITAAVDGRDINRLTGIYHWIGVPDSTARRVLKNLEDVVERPLLDIVPIRPRPAPVTDDAGNVIDENADGYYPQTTTASARPIGLRLHQTLRNGTTPTETVFWLRRNWGCFWISY